MRKQNSQPAKLGTVGVGHAHIQVINVNTMRWETLGTCLDTPNAINAEVARIRKDHPHADLWVRNMWGERKPIEK